MTGQRRQEMLMAEGLRTGEPGLDIRRVAATDPPRPDILLELGSGKVVGLEVRALTDPDTKAGLASRRRAGAAAEALLQGRRVDAHVDWVSGSIIPAREADDVGRLIGAAILRMLEEGRVTLGELDEIPVELRAFVEIITLFVAESAGPRVRTTTETWRGSADSDVVQRALDAKERRIAGYRNAHPGRAVWLLLWTSAGEAQPVAAVLLDPAQAYQSTFDRAFVLDYPRGEVVELRLLRKE